MKKITLKSLHLNNFQGGTFTLETNGVDVSVYGRNAAGKTRIASAVSWLLFGKDSLGRADFAIKDLDANGDVAQRGIEHRVEAVLSVDGDTITLKKVYKEKWTKPRGRAKAEFSGHATDHFVDGVPKSEKEYKEIVAEIAGAEETFRLITSPTAFPALHWQKQRALLMEICGDVSTADVLDSMATIGNKDDIAVLTGIVNGKKTIEEHRKEITSKKSAINKTLESIPVRLDECNRSLPDISGLNEKAIEKEVATLETKLNDAKLRLQGVQTGGKMAELTKEIAEIDGQIQKLKSAFQSSTLDVLGALQRSALEAAAKVNTAESQVTAIADQIAMNQRFLSRIDLESLRKTWTEIDADEFDDTTETVCPTCGQGLPEDRVQEAREKGLALFNRSKAERLEKIDEHGKALRQECDKLTDKIKLLESEKTAKESTISALRDERDRIELQVAEARVSAATFEATPEYRALLEVRQTVEKAIRDEKAGRNQDTEAIEKGIAETENLLFEVKGNLDKFRRRKDGETRIEQLKADEKVFAGEFEELERQLFLCEQFVRAKVALLTERINGKFETVRFKLFNELVNGGIEDVCEITVNGIGLNSGLNNAGRIQSGCDIIRTLQKHYGLLAPVIIDNRESVTRIPAMNCQVISLIVSEPDNVLRVELAGMTERAAA